MFDHQGKINFWLIIFILLHLKNVRLYYIHEKLFFLWNANENVAWQKNSERHLLSVWKRSKKKLRIQFQFRLINFASIVLQCLSTLYLWLNLHTLAVKTNWVCFLLFFLRSILQQVWAKKFEFYFKKSGGSRHVKLHFFNFQFNIKIRLV